MLRKHFALLLLALPLSSTWAQRISGTVTDSLGTPINQASVIEVDIDHRILSSTKTDAAGNFNMNLRNADATRLRIFADGYQMLTQRSTKGQKQNFMLAKRTDSRLSQLEKAYPSTKRNYVLSEKLLSGHSTESEVPWTVMLEQLGDSTYILRLPVKASAQSDEYREGRSICFLDWGDAQLLMAYNGEDTPPISGFPGERNTWRVVTNKEYENFSIHNSRGTVKDAEESLYFYPAFILTLSEMKQLQKEADHFARLIIDTEMADNYWIMYPRQNFGKELEKVLKKLEAQHKK